VLHSFAILILAGALAPVSPRPLSLTASVTTPAFNPSLSGTCDVLVETNRDAAVSLEVTDRSGSVIRRVAGARSAAGTPLTIQWDGRDDAGVVVPDGAWRLALVAVDQRERAAWPAASPGHDVLTVLPRYYDRERGLLGYDLPWPSIVTVEAAAGIDGETRRHRIVLDAPRTRGSVLEPWNGVDGDGRYLPSLPGFAITIVANPLGDEWVISYGNRDVSRGGQEEGR
jgi:hypothetical protein